MSAIRRQHPPRSTCRGGSPASSSQRRRSATSGGDEGFYQYRDRSAIELAASATFEEAWQLLVTGDAATDASRGAFAGRDGRGPATTRRRRGRASRAVASATPDVLAGLAAAWPLLGARRGIRPLYDLDEASAPR